MTTHNGFQLYYGEEFCVCPYNMSHILTNHRISDHVMKCRKAYIKEVEGKKQVVHMSTCRYNEMHKVVTVELEYHEENCVNRHRMPEHYFAIEVGKENAAKGILPYDPNRIPPESDIEETKEEKAEVDSDEDWC